MRISLLLFGYLREKAGRSRWVLELEPGATVGDAVRKAAEETGLAPEWLKAVRAARNQEYCDVDVRLAEGDEVALIPPVSGG